MDFHILFELSSLMALIGEQISTGLLLALTPPLLLLLPFFLLPTPPILPHPFIILSFCLKLFKVIEFCPSTQCGCRGSRVADPSPIVKVAEGNLHNKWRSC